MTLNDYLQNPTTMLLPGTDPSLPYKDPVLCLLRRLSRQEELKDTIQTPAFPIPHSPKSPPKPPIQHIKSSFPLSFTLGVHLRFKNDLQETSQLAIEDIYIPELTGQAFSIEPGYVLNTLRYYPPHGSFSIRVTTPSKGLTQQIKSVQEL